MWHIEEITPLRHSISEYIIRKSVVMKYLYPYTKAKEKLRMVRVGTFFTYTASANNMLRWKTKSFMNSLLVFMMIIEMEEKHSNWNIPVIVYHINVFWYVFSKSWNESEGKSKLCKKAVLFLFNIMFVVCLEIFFYGCWIQFDVKWCA